MKKVSPKVTLINHGGFVDACIAALNCTNEDSIEDLEEKLEDEEFCKKLLKSVIVDNGHHSIAEFIHFTFAIEGIHLSTSHQWVRHRIVSNAQKSQRYITHKELSVSLPSSMNDNSKIDDLFNRSYDLYNELIKSGIKAEDARLVLPQGVSTSIVCKFNLRELYHILEERLCTCAQNQIRDDVAKEMFRLAKIYYPYLLANAGPKCYNLGRCPEKRNNKGCQLYKKSIHYRG